MAKKETAVQSAQAEPMLGGVLENEHVRRWGPSVGLALLACFFLWPSLHGVFTWDDDQWLTANPWVQSWGGLKQIWLSPALNAQYYPLVFTTFWAEHKLWGLNGVAYHAVNLLLHVATALLIFKLLKKLKLPGGTLGAWLAATIFAIHPINVESVAWVAERKNVLCGVFFFAAMLYALKFFGVIDAKEGNGAAERPCWKRYAAAIILFLLAMLSKTTACVLPPAILLMIWWRRGKMTRREILLVVPFFLIAAGLGSITTWTEHGPTGTTGTEWIYSPLARAVAEHPAAATTGMRLAAMGQEFVARTLIAGQAVWFYVGKIFWPYPVVQVYPRFSFDVASPALYIAPISLLLVLIILFALRRRITRGPLTAALFFVGALFPALGYINFYTMLYTFVADHYQYLACIGVIVLGVETLLWALRKASATVPTDLATVDEGAVRFFRLTSGLVSVGLILALGIQTRGVSDLYTNGEALWKFNTDTNPAAFAAWNNLATAITHRQVTTAAEVEQQRLDAIDALQHSIVAAPWDWRLPHPRNDLPRDQQSGKRRQISGCRRGADARLCAQWPRKFLRTAGRPEHTADGGRGGGGIGRGRFRCDLQPEFSARTKLRGPRPMGCRHRLFHERSAGFPAKCRILFPYRKLRSGKERLRRGSPVVHARHRQTADLCRSLLQSRNLPALAGAGTGGGCRSAQVALARSHRGPKSAGPSPGGGKKVSHRSRPGEQVEVTRFQGSSGWSSQECRSIR